MDENNNNSSTEQQCYILNIPIENLLIILKQLNSFSLLKLSLVNTYFNQLIIDSAIIWNKKLKDDFNITKEIAITKYNLLNKPVNNNNNIDSNHFFSDDDEDEDEEEDDDEDEEDDGEEEKEDSKENNNTNEMEHVNSNHEGGNGSDMNIDDLDHFSVYRLLYSRFNQRIYHHYKTMKIIWNRLENWMIESNLPQMKQSLVTIDQSELEKIKYLDVFEKDSTTSNFKANEQNNCTIFDILPSDYICSILINNGQKENTPYGLLGTIKAYDSKTNIYLFSYQQSHSYYLKTRYMKTFDCCWFIAGSYSKRYYVMVIKDFVINDSSFVRGQILLVAPVKPILIANSYWEFLEKHATLLEKNVFTTRKNILYRYPEYSRFTGETVTNGVRIKATAVYMPEWSPGLQEDFNNYTFFYRITVSMDKDEDPINSCKLLRRHWVISTKSGSTSVDGDGVIGLFPTIKPGTVFEYCSRCELEFQNGSMSGYFTMTRLNDNSYKIGDDHNKTFQAQIPLFFLTTDQQ